MPTSLATAITCFFFIIGVSSAVYILRGSNEQHCSSCQRQLQQAVGKSTHAPHTQNKDRPSTDWVATIVSPTATIKIVKDHGSTTAAAATKVTLDGRQSKAPWGRTIAKWTWHTTGELAGSKKAVKLEHTGQLVELQLKSGVYRTRLLVIDSSGSSAAAEEAIRVVGPAQQQTPVQQPAPAAPVAAPPGNAETQPTMALQSSQPAPSMPSTPGAVSASAEPASALPPTITVISPVVPPALLPTQLPPEEVPTPPLPDPSPSAAPTPAPMPSPAAAAAAAPLPAPSQPPKPVPPKVRPQPRDDYDDYEPDTPLPPAPQRAGPIATAISD